MTFANAAVKKLPGRRAWSAGGRDGAAGAGVEALVAPAIGFPTTTSGLARGCPGELELPLPLPILWGAIPHAPHAKISTTRPHQPDQAGTTWPRTQTRHEEERRDERIIKRGRRRVCLCVCLLFTRELSFSYSGTLLKYT